MVGTDRQREVSGEGRTCEQREVSKAYLCITPGVCERKRGRGMSEAEMREEIQKMLAEADRATLSEVRVFLQYYLGVQGQNGGNV